MNLPTLKASAEKANTSPLELEIWQMEISPDVVLRLVEVALLAKEVRQVAKSHGSGSAAFHLVKERFHRALEGIEP